MSLLQENQYYKQKKAARKREGVRKERYRISEMRKLFKKRNQVRVLKRTNVNKSKDPTSRKSSSRKREMGNKVESIRERESFEAVKGCFFGSKVRERGAEKTRKSVIKKCENKRKHLPQAKLVYCQARLSSLLNL